MARASYQHIDNIRIGKGPVSISLVKKNHKKIKVCLKGADFPSGPTSYSILKPIRPKLKLKLDKSTNRGKIS